MSLHCGGALRGNMDTAMLYKFKNPLIIEEILRIHKIVCTMADVA